MIPRSSNISFTSDWIQQIPTSISLLDTNLNYVSASPSWLTKFNFIEENLINKNIFEIFPHFSKEWEPRLKYCLDGLTDLKIIDHGETGNLLWNLNPWKDGYGNIVGIILKVEKLPKTKELELELKKTQNLLDQKGKIAKIGSWNYSVSSDQLTWSPSVYKIYGLPETVPPNLELAFGHYEEGESRNIIKKRINEAIEDGKPWNENLKLTQGNGKTIWVNSIGRPKFLEGKCVRVIGTVQDITESYTKTLTSQKSSLKDAISVFENVDIGLVLIDFKSGLITEANQKALAIMGLEKSQVLKNNFSRYLNRKANKKIQSASTDLLKTGSYGPADIPYLTSEKKEKIIQLSCKIIRPDNNVYALASLQDITTEHNKENRLKYQLKTAEAHIDHLVNFAHAVSHNLKAHTTNFSLLLNFMKKEDGEAERKKLLGMLFNATDNLSETIKGLREIVAIENNLNGKKKPLKLNDYVFKVEQILFALLKKYDCKIINEIPENTKVLGIEAYLESILTNCITNAIKYRQPDKSPIIILSIEDTKNFTVLNIEDNGLGIDLEKCGDKLFGLYKTFHKNEDAKGVGLYIVKKQIEAMNGKICVESTLNEGTTFKIFFNKE